MSQYADDYDFRAHRAKHIKHLSAFKRRTMKYNPGREELEGAIAVYLKNGGTITKLEGKRV